MKHSPFRAIRQKLFHEGKLLRYLSYAIGEILLIIIGIMLALQLNNWNENRKEQQEFDAYLVQLREDVKTAISNIQTHIETNSEFIELGVELIRFLEAGKVQPDEMESFKYSLHRLGRYEVIQVHVGLLGRLMDGDYDLIGRDPSLANHAMAMESTIEKQLAIGCTINTRIDHLRAELTKFYATGTYDYQLEAKYDLELLLNSNEFHLLTQNTVRALEATTGFSGYILNEVEKFLTVLEEY